MVQSAIRYVLNRRISKLFFASLCGVILAIAACTGSSNHDNLILRALCALAAMDSTSFTVAGQMGFSAYSLDGGLSYTEDSPGNTSDFTDSEWNLGGIWSVGKGGALFHKLSLSASYTEVDSGTSEDLYDLKWASPTVGIAVGANGVMTRSADAGISWRPMQIAAGNLYGIDCPTAELCWTVGERGSLFRSQNAGIDWERINFGVSSDISLRGLYAPTQNQLWVVGDGGFVSRTADAGMTFQRVNSGTMKDLYSVFVTADGQNGMVGGDEFLGTISNNSLTKLVDDFIELGIIYKKMVMALDGPSLFIAGSRGTLLETPDYGGNFTRLPIIIGSSTGGSFGDTMGDTIGNSDNFGDTFGDTSTDDDTSETAPVAGFIVSKQDFSFSHNVGTTECPQKIGEFLLENTGGVALDFSISVRGGGPVVASPNSGISLQPGESRTVSLFFNCSQTSSFDVILDIVGSGAGGASAAAAANVKGNVG